MRARGLPIIAALVALMAVTAHGPDADAAPNARRAIAVVEFRAGSSALPTIAAAIARDLSTRTSLQVLGPDQARSTFGADLDEAVARCAGEAACIAGIGTRLKVSELILVGVSEFGDVILTLQRIEVTQQVVSNRVAESLPAGATPTEAAISGYLERLMPPGDFLRFGVIDIIANVAGAEVRIGGEVKGTTPLPPTRVRAPATYDLRVDKAGYLPFRAQIAVPGDGTVQVRAELGKRPHRAWYQHWYVVAGAAVLVAGATGTAIWLATDDPTSVPVSGTID